MIKTEIQPCVNVDLVDSLKKIESNILTQAVDSNMNFSNSLATCIKQLAAASKSTQEIISKWDSYQLQKKINLKILSTNYQWIIKGCY